MASNRRIPEGRMLAQKIKDQLIEVKATGLITPSLDLIQKADLTIWVSVESLTTTSVTILKRNLDIEYMWHRYVS